MQQKDILTIKDVAEYLQISEETVTDWAQKGEIPCGKLGNCWRFKRIEVEHWVNRKLVGSNRKSKTRPIAIADVLTAERVLFLNASSKRAALNTMIDCLAQSPEILDRDELAYEIFFREDLMSTGIGLGVAIPHVRLPSLPDKTIMAAALIRSGLTDYSSMDGEPVKLVFMIASGHHQHAEYLKLLSSLADFIKDETARQQLIRSNSPEEFFNTLSRQQRK